MECKLKPTICICSDGPFLLYEYSMYPLYNYESTNLDDELNTRIKFDIFDISPEKKLNRSLDYYLDDIKLSKKYYFIKEKIGYECAQVLKNDRIIITEETSEDYLKCLKLEQL